MDTVCVDFIDVNSHFFGMNFDLSKYAIFFDDEKDMQVLMNEVISKPRAIDKALERFEEERSPFANLYISQDAMECGMIRDYSGEKIFPQINDDISGWLFFFDSTPFANWNHACKYLLVVNENCMEMTTYNKGVSDVVQLEKIY